MGTIYYFVPVTQMLENFFSNSREFIPEFRGKLFNFFPAKRYHSCVNNRTVDPYVESQLSESKYLNTVSQLLGTSLEPTGILAVGKLSVPVDSTCCKADFQHI
jgi:hypothetical protein